MAFLSKPDTGGFSDFLDRRRKRRFVSGGTGAGIEEDTAVLNATLDAESDRQRRLVALSNQQQRHEDSLAFNEQQLAQQQGQFDERLAFEHDQNRDSTFSQVIGPAVGLGGALLQRGATNRLSNALLGVKTQPASSIGQGILRFFGFN